MSYLSAAIRGRQLQLSDDSVGLTSMAAGANVDIQPASGEFDIVTIGRDSTSINWGLYDGTTRGSGIASDRPTMLNTTNISYLRITNDNVGAQNYMRAITTLTEET